VAVPKVAVVQALNRVRLPGADRSPSALGLILDVLVGADDRVTLLVADRLPSDGAEPVPEAWVERLRAAAAAVPGVREVVVERRPPDSVPPSLQQARGRPVVDLGTTRVVAVASGKGGVGKSTVTANLAAALAAQGHRVAALDADIYGFSLPTLLGVREGPTVTRDRRLVPAVAPGGVRVLSMDFFVPGNQPVVWRGPMLGKALYQFLTDAVWEDLELLLLDLPPGTGDVALDVHEMLPKSEEIVVTTPDPVAARVAVRAGEMARKAGHRVLGVVENMSYLRCPHCGGTLEPFGRGGGETVAEALGAPLLARLPFGEPAEPGTGLYGPDTETGRAFRDLAERLLAALSQPSPA
jgi:ATP-binding protein involved in chromosome partitioning